MMNTKKFRLIPRVETTPVNAGESRSVVGSENDAIARAMSLLIGVIGQHPGRLTYPQALDVLAAFQR